MYYTSTWEILQNIFRIFDILALFSLVLEVFVW